MPTMLIHLNSPELETKFGNNPLVDLFLIKNNWVEIIFTDKAKERFPFFMRRKIMQQNQTIKKNNILKSEIIYLNYIFVVTKCNRLLQYCKLKDLARILSH